MSKLTDRDKSIYEWQLDIPGFGEDCQLKLRQSTAFISRAGGLGGPGGLANLDPATLSNLPPDVRKSLMEQIKQQQQQQKMIEMMQKQNQ